MSLYTYPSSRFACTATHRSRLRREIAEGFQATFAEAML
jgi:hypothetical protein